MEYNNEIGTVSFNLKEPNSDKPTLIKGIYLFKKTQTGFSTGIKVLPSHWDKTEKKVLAGENKKTYNSKLNSYKVSIPKSHTDFNNLYHRFPTKEELKTIVHNAVTGKEFLTVNKSKKNFKDIFDDMTQMLELKKQQALSIGQPSTHKSYISSFKVTYADLIEFAEEKKEILDIDTFDENMSLKFQIWLSKKKVSENGYMQSATIRTRIKRLSQVLRRAFQKGYTTNRSFMQSDFSAKSSPANKIALTEKEITDLYEFDFKENKRLEKVRDLFVLSCHTSLRFGDISRIVTQHIDWNNKTIRILTSKGDKYVTIPFFGYTEEILKKYDGNIKSIAISNQNANIYLKEIFTVVPYFDNKKFVTEVKTGKGITFNEIPYSEKITFHDSRRSFCTNRYIEGWDLLEIFQYTGHTDEKTFKGYFKPTAEHERIRKENILARNEKLQRVDLQNQQIEELKKQIEELTRQNAKVININQNVS
ncbi:integrase [Epilithonimonas hungarica]|uniref:tyrosine-type recombinase/integrase n=1 Tax=Epilithonimonas hungarica TaxID=454006 RepID=UPI00278A42E8|nr:tyrosine-type recombinase/integrase [Epilithonimonas hungarica]MDP9954796.1 integrase [Epilithonimonas hungarica]